jgi:hypothetical protein
LKDKEISAYHDYTKPFYDLLYFNPKEVFKGIDKENRIKTMPIIILGTAGIGKTTTAKNIMAKIQGWYKDQGVCLVYTNNVSLGTLMAYAFKVREQMENKKPKVYILTFDDATAVKTKTDEVRKFFSVRHTAEEQGGIKEGIVYSIFITHDWYYLDKIFRRYGFIAIILSVPPLDEYSKKHIERLIGKRAVIDLERNFVIAIKQDSAKGRGYVKLPYIPKNERNHVGYVQFKNIDTEYIKVIQDKECNEAVLDPVHLDFHVPVEKVKTDDDIKVLYEDRKRKDRERKRKYRHKIKEELKNVLGRDKEG